MRRRGIPGRSRASGRRRTVPQPSAASEDEREQVDFPDAAGLVCEFSFEFGEVGLGLLAGLGLEAPLELGRRVRPDRAETVRHRRVAAFVAELLDLSEQPASGQIRAVPDLVREIVLVRLQKPRPRLPRRIGRSREAPVQKLADRLAVQARPARDRADRKAFPFQFLQHDNLLQLDHPTRASFGRKIGWDFGLLSFRGGACPPERIRSPLTGEFCFGAFGEF